MKVYYNEIDKKACAWLRELMNDGLIPEGVIDDRSIIDVQPGDLRGFTQCHFFAGIGGWSLALRLAGWPEGREVWTGSCPCQPLSCAGKGLGHADERHLWPAFHRLISECRPATAIGEQVASKDGREWFAGIRADLEDLGYACGCADLCAAGVGAPHIRQRLYWVADSTDAGSSSEREAQEREPRSDTACGRSQVGRLADSNSTKAHTAEQRQCLSGTGLQSGRLADAELRPPEQRDQGQRTVQQPDASGATCGLGHAVSSGLKTCYREYIGTGQRSEQPADSSSCGRLGNAYDPGQREQCRAESVRQKQPTAELRSDVGFWSSAIWHACRDGKARRVPCPQSGVFSVADGVPDGVDISWLESSFPLAKKIEGRVGLLRGYGNAIVPQVAAEFISAYLETA